MRNKKKIVIGILCAIVMVMAVGYALLAQELNITGRASIDSLWQVEITKITSRDIVGGASNKETTSYAANTATLDIGLIQPGDSITYDIEVTNKGTLDAVVDMINVTMDENDAISYTTSGLKIGDKLTKNGGTNTFSIRIEYKSSVTSQPTNTAGSITVTINCEQDLGQEIGYGAYSIGDVVTFAGSNWYVINNSTAEEDYVTLMKEKVLTNEELGEYAANETKICEEWMVTEQYYGCKEVGETVVIISDTMPYYWSDTCHYDGYYGYTNYDSSGCSRHNDYEGSKVQDYLEGTYINTLGPENLKEVDGYKVRLITKEELQNNLGYDTKITASYYQYNPENTPSWVYQNFGEGSDDVFGYWTMTPSSRTTSLDAVWYVSNSKNIYDVTVNYKQGVRPVINLLKSSI